MWFKKKSVLQGEGHYNTEFSADGSTDLRTTWKYYGNTSSSITNSGLPDVADAGNYFYLPALSFYNSGQLLGVSGGGGYWSSSAYPSSSNDAYNLGFYSSGVDVGVNGRYNGYRAEAFQ